MFTDPLFIVLFVFFLLRGITSRIVTAQRVKKGDLPTNLRGDEPYTLVTAPVVRIVILSVISAVVFRLVFIGAEAAFPWHKWLPSMLHFPFAFISEQLSWWNPDLGTFGQQVYPLAWGSTNAQPVNAQANTLINIVLLIVIERVIALTQQSPKRKHGDNTPATPQA